MQITNKQLLYYFCSVVNVISRMLEKCENKLKRRVEVLVQKFDSGLFDLILPAVDCWRQLTAWSCSSASEEWLDSRTMNRTKLGVRCRNIVHQLYLVLKVVKAGQRQRLVLKLDQNAKDLSRLLIASAIVHNNIIIVCRNNLTLKDS